MAKHIVDEQEQLIYLDELFYMFSNEPVNEARETWCTDKMVLPLRNNYRAN